MEEISKQKQGEQPLQNFGIAPVQQIKTWLLAYVRPTQTFEAQRNIISVKKIFADLILMFVVWLSIFSLFSLSKPTTILTALGNLFPVMLSLLVIFSFVSALFFIVAKLLGGKASLLEHAYAFDLLYGGFWIILAFVYVCLMAAYATNLVDYPMGSALISGANLLMLLFLAANSIILVQRVHKLSIIKTASLFIAVPILAVIALIIWIIYYVMTHGIGTIRMS